MNQPVKHTLERRRLTSEPSSSGVSDGDSSRRSSTGSNSSSPYRPGSAGSDSGLDQSRDSSPNHVPTIRRQISQNLTTIEKQVPNEVNLTIPMNESGIGMQEMIEAEAVQLVSEEYHEAKEDESFLPPPEVCCESNPTRVLVEVSMRKKSTTRIDRFMDSVLKAAQEFCREDKEAASEKLHEMNQLYRERISELDSQVSSLCNLLESEQHIKEAEQENALLDIQEKERISQREEQLAKKEREIYRMREEQEEMHAKIKRTENEVDRLQSQLSRQPRRKILAKLKELVDLLEKADDPKSVKTAINEKIETLKLHLGDRPRTAHV